MSLVAQKYMPSGMPEAELEATFAARGHTVDYLVKMLRDQTQSGTLSSFVVTGPRGAGKSTVLRMVALRLKEDDALSAAWLPVFFPEEQFNITSLRELLAATLRELSTQDVPSARAWLDKVEAEPNDEQSEQLAVTGLRKITRTLKRRLVLFIENLNLLLEKGLTDQEKGALRRLLMSDPFMMVLGSAVHVFDSLRSYDEAFFNYLGEVPLDRLSAEQVCELLALRAKFDGNDRFLREFPQNQAKVRAIVHLSGGNPRLILMLYELLSQKQVTSVVQQLRRLVDELTPLLKHEMESLPPQQRKIIHALMELGGTAQPSALVAPTRLKLNTITEQLRRLKQAQILVLLGGGKGRPAYYTVPDQLFGIWYQMRYLGQNRRRIELFVEVLRVWFETEERFQTIRRIQAGPQGASPAELREVATTGEYFAASLVGTAYEASAREIAVCHWLRTGDLHETALAHAEFALRETGDTRPSDVQAYASFGHWSLEHEDPQTALAALAEAAKSNPRPEVMLDYGRALFAAGRHAKALEQFEAVIAAASGNAALLASGLVGRGAAKGMAGNPLGELADYTAAIELAAAPDEQIAMALVNRGAAKGEAGDLPGQLADYTAVVALPEAPAGYVAQALVNRGVTREMAGDLPGAMADYTAVVEMAGAPKAQVAMALVNRALAAGATGDHARASADFTAVIEMGGATAEQTARALANRAVAASHLGNGAAARADWERVLRMDKANAAAAIAAASGLFRLHCAAARREDAMLALRLFRQWLGARSERGKAADIVRLLSSLAMPALREEWPQAWRLLAAEQPPGVAEALEFLKPVAEVLEGADASTLNGLSPEQREFARSILARFNAGSRND